MISGVLALLLVLFVGVAPRSLGAQSPGAQPPGAQPSGSQPVDAAPRDRTLYREISRQLVAEAETLLAVGATREDVSSLIDRAVSIDPSLGDAWYYRAQLLANDQLQTRARERFLRNALERDRAFIDSERVVADLAELLIRTDREREAVNLITDHTRETYGLSPVQRTVGAVRAADSGSGSDTASAVTNRTTSADTPLQPLDRLYVMALMAADASWFTGDYLQRLRARFPHDGQLAELDLVRGRRLSLAALEWIDLALENGWDVPPAYLLHAAQRANVSAVRDRLFAHYLDTGGRDLLAVVSLILSGEAGSAGATVSERIALPLAEDRLLWEEIYANRARLTESSIGALNALLSGSGVNIDVVEEAAESDGATAAGITSGDGQSAGFSSVSARWEPSIFADIEMVLDTDRDGFAEERYAITNGQISAWREDENQDGISERAVLFTVADDAGDPSPPADPTVRVIVPWRQGHVIIRYIQLPVVAAVVYVDETRVIRWAPPRPVPFDPGIILQTRTQTAGTSDVQRAGWNAMAARVTLSLMDGQRFARQIESDDARELAQAEAQAYRQVLEENGFVEE